MNQQMLRVCWLTSSFAEKVLRILVAKLNLNQQCVLPVMATNILDCSRKTTARPYSLLSSGEAIYGVLGPVLGSPVQEGSLLQQIPFGPWDQVKGQNGWSQEDPSNLNHPDAVLGAEKKDVENLGWPAITETTEKGDSVMYRKCMDILGNDGFCQMHRIGSGKSTGEMNKDG